MVVQLSALQSHLLNAIVGVIAQLLYYLVYLLLRFRMRRQPDTMALSATTLDSLQGNGFEGGTFAEVRMASQGVTMAKHVQWLLWPLQTLWNRTKRGRVSLCNLVQHPCAWHPDDV